MHILLGVRGDELSFHALEETVERARTADDDVTVAVFEGAENRSLTAIEEQARDQLEQLDFDAPVRRIEADPGSMLVSLAEEEDFDRIVLAGGQRSPLGKIQLDPVLEFVLLNATTTVTLVR